MGRGWFRLGHGWLFLVVLVVWVLCVVLCWVKMLKVVFVCVSWCFFVSGCFNFSKLFRLHSQVIGSCVSCVGWFRFVIGKCGCFIMFLSCFSWLFWFLFVVG